MCHDRATHLLEGHDAVDEPRKVQARAPIDSRAIVEDEEYLALLQLVEQVGKVLTPQVELARYRRANLHGRQTICMT